MLGSCHIYLFFFKCIFIPRHQCFIPAVLRCKAQALWHHKASFSPPSFPPGIIVLGGKKVNVTQMPLEYTGCNVL